MLFNAEWNDHLFGRLHNLHYIDINPTSGEILYFACSLSNHIDAIIPIDADIKVEIY